MKRQTAIATLLVLTLAVTTVQQTHFTEPAEAANASQFNPGMIISDALFFDGNAMSAGAVQDFLNSQVTSCVSGYTCLKNFVQATPTRAAVAGRCDTYTGSGSESAATIIAKVGKACGISQEAILVLLEKEQSLVTSRSPGSGSYRSATGYGCPDTAACDSTYYGFFNQVYAAALQFKRYAANPTGWNHIAGRVNNILFNPNSACGASAVLIQNQATAGLYNYTPYQPNQAALANLYGTGDGCSAYGNRNFWRIFTDWFGSTTVSSLARTADNPGVYLIVGDRKYSVPNMTILGALSPLGPLSIVSQTYLDTLTTGPQQVGRILRSPDGSIFFIDSAIKLPFTSCPDVEQYGGSCGTTGYVNVTAAQASMFISGPPMMSVMGTREGTRYFISNAVKREILDDASQRAAGLPFGFPILTEAALSAFPYGPPVTRDSVFVATRGTSEYSFIEKGARLTVSAADTATLGAASRSAGSLRAESLAKMTAGGAFTGVFTAPGSTQVQIIIPEGRVRLAAPTTTGLSAIALSQASVDLYPDAGVIEAGAFVKSPSDPAVYLVTPESLRSIPSWEALVSLSNNASPSIRTLPSAVISQLPKGTAALGPGLMYRSPNDAQIYLIDGLGSALRVANFENTDALGIYGFRETTAQNLAPYTSTTKTLGFGVVCAGTRYVAAGGVLRTITDATAALYPFTFTELGQTTCARLTIGTPAVDLIRTSSGAIFKLVAGQKQHVSAARLSAANTGQGWMQVPDSFAALLPAGPAF